MKKTIKKLIGVFVACTLILTSTITSFAASDLMDRTLSHSKSKGEELIKEMLQELHMGCLDDDGAEVFIESHVNKLEPEQNPRLRAACSHTNSIYLYSETKTYLPGDNTYCAKAQVYGLYKCSACKVTVSDATTVVGVFHSWVFRASGMYECSNCHKYKDR